jgi:lipopolysaccharide transport system ATP-binding protein
VLMESTIEVDHISKKFSYNMKSALKYGARDIIKAALGITGESNGLRPGEFWAVRNATFDLKPGECLGLMGLNGSGKSTLLKMLNGIYLPDDGEIRVLGRVGALIELGAGFHPNLTGRQNIYTKGALMGLHKQEIDSIFDNIVDFADIGKFIDSPVKIYSSGMYVRLGFSVAINIRPDILLVDEVLAVGDFKFRQKCLEKINELRHKMAVILVSHNINDIILFCNRAIVLEKGKISYEGPPKEAAAFYLDEIESKAKKRQAHKKEIKEEKSIKASFAGEIFHNKEKITDIAVKWVDDSCNEISSIKPRQYLALDITFKTLVVPNRLVIGVPIWTIKGDYVTGISTDMTDQQILVGPEGRVTARLVFDKHIFNPGKYIAVTAIHDRTEYLYRNVTKEFEILPTQRHFGFVTAEHRWEFN